MHSGKVFFIFLIYSFAIFADFVDLESSFKDLLIETKQINIPGYPNAFNPSLIRFKGKLLLSFRIIPNPKNNFVSYIGLVFLDPSFNTISEPQILCTRSEILAPSRADDARLIQVNDTLYLVYSDNKDEKITRGGFRVVIGQLKFNGKQFSIHNVDFITEFEGSDPNKREKNWVPFVYQNELLLSYSLDPHQVFRYLPGKGQAESFSFSNNKIDWDWGELRGGTQAYLCQGEYLAFFHSSKMMKTIHSDEKDVTHYFMGAYTFKSEPPFDITKISPEPIVGKNFYKGKIYTPYWKPVRVVFPCGYVLNEHEILLAYGRQDHEVWIARLNKNKLLNSLKAVE